MLRLRSHIRELKEFYTGEMLQYHIYALTVHEAYELQITH
jgi:hypothetical protein